MIYYSYRGNYPITELPDRIRLSSGLTRTDKNTFTEDELIDAGFVVVDAPPEIDLNKHYLEWDGLNLTWKVLNFSYEEKEKEVLDRINLMLEKVNWRIEKYNREERLGIPHSDVFDHIKLYLNQLINIPKQKEYPFIVSWPDEIGSASDRLNGNIR